jgi:hypothetical protein
MTDATRPRFDPRHDPLFQRGYDPAAPVSDVARRDAPASGPASAPASAGTGAPARGAEEPHAYSHLGLVQPGLHPDGEPVPRRNPYIRALWITGVALVVVGIGLAWQANAYSANYSYSGGAVPFAMILQQLIWILVPSMVTVGMATIVALVFWEALRWRTGNAARDLRPEPRPDSPPPHPDQPSS